jgi:hypothetical protein
MSGNTFGLAVAQMGPVHLADTREAVVKHANGSEFCWQNTVLLSTNFTTPAANVSRQLAIPLIIRALFSVA